MVAAMRRRNILIAVVTVLVLAAGLGVWLWPDGDVDATTSDAPSPNAGSEVPFAFDKPAWTRSLPDDAEVVADEQYAIVRERTGVRVYELWTGAERWHYLHRGLTVTDIATYWGKLTVLSTNEVRLFDLETGELLSTVPVTRGGDRTATPINENYFLVLSDGKDEYRLYSNDGQEQWARKPAACATSTRVYYGSSNFILESSCAGKTVLARLNLGSGNVFKSAEVPDTSPPAAPNPPTAILLPQDGPIVLTTPDHAVVAVNELALTPAPARPSPAAEELTSMRNGWCAYTTTPEPVVTCQDARTGAVYEQPYLLADNGNVVDPRVRIFTVETEPLVAATTDSSVTVGYVGDHPTEVMSGVVDPDVAYYGRGALVVSTEDRLTVYTSRD
jgi:hypothetical protein